MQLLRGSELSRFLQCGHFPFSAKVGAGNREREREPRAPFLPMEEQPHGVVLWLALPGSENWQYPGSLFELKMPGDGWGQ